MIKFTNLVKYRESELYLDPVKEIWEESCWNGGSEQAEFDTIFLKTFQAVKR